MKNIVIITILYVMSFQVFAGYDSNLSGVVTKVLTYASGRIYIVLENQPSSHPACEHKFFAIDNTLSSDIRSQMLSRALVAFASKQVLNIGYDGEGDCANGKIRIHRLG